MKKLAYISILCLLLACGSPEEETVDCQIPEQVSYKVDIVPILENNCYRCHSEDKYASKADGNLLEGYAALKKKVDNGALIPSIFHEDGYVNMPYKEPMLDTCLLITIKTWVEQGALDN